MFLLASNAEEHGQESNRKRKPSKTMAKFPALEVAVPVPRITLPDPDDKPSNEKPVVRENPRFSPRDRTISRARRERIERESENRRRANYRPVILQRQHVGITKDNRQE